MDQKRIKIAVDFDDTCTINEWPSIGPEAPHCVYVLKLLRENGVLLILHTLRRGYELNAAEAWFEDRDIDLYGVNEDPDLPAMQAVRKLNADLFIDDRAIGCPMTETVFDGKACKHVDWIMVKKILTSKGII